MPDPKRATQEMLQALSLETSPQDRVLVPALLMLGVLAATLRLLAGDWAATFYTLGCTALLFVLAAFPRAAHRLMPRSDAGMPSSSSCSGCMA
jgi:hypothetical protein